MYKKMLFAGVIGFFAVTRVYAVELPTQAYLPLDVAQQAATAALDSCHKEGYRVSVAVVDRSGTLLTLVRHPQAGPHTVGSSQGKAFTSASMGQASAKLASMIGEKPFLEGLRDMDDRLVILGGGLPVVINGERVGGIGVGGAPGGHLDEACASEGLKAIAAK